MDSDVIKREYYEMIESMGGSVKERNVATWFVWNHIGQVLYIDVDDLYTQSCKYLLYLLGEQSYEVSDIMGMIDNSTEQYEEWMSEFSIGTSVEELGTHWKKMIADEHVFDMRRLYGVVRGIYEILLPFCNEEMKKFGLENIEKYTVNNFEDIEKKRTQRYKKERAKCKESLVIVTTAEDVLTLIRQR